jgi:hypothetical protein
MSITDEKLDYEIGEKIACHIEHWLREQKGYENHDFFVQDIHYFNWDEQPAYFCFLIEDGKSLKQGAKYIELIVREMGYCYPEAIEFSTHGFPCNSTHVWEVIL